MIQIRFILSIIILILLTGSAPAPKTFTIDTDSSLATWRWHSGQEQHSGTVYISSGELLADNGSIKSGIVSVDLTSLSVSTVRDLQHNSRVTGWMKGREFFDTYNHPVAVLKIISVRHEADNRYTLNGSMTLKDKIQPVRVPVTFSFDKKKIEIFTHLIIDQLKSGAVNETVDDSFKLNLHLVAKRR